MLQLKSHWICTQQMNRSENSVRHTSVCEKNIMNQKQSSHTSKERCYHENKNNSLMKGCQTVRNYRTLIC